MANIKHARALDRGQFARLIKITRATSRYADRDVLVLMLGHKAGMRITEITRITVADVMFPSGRLREEVSLREVVTKGCKQRCAFLSSKPLTEALEGYLAYRIDRGIGTELGDGLPYRGLLPHLPLIWSSRGGGHSQNTKRRTLVTGEVRDYKANDSLQSHVTKLYRNAGLRGGSSHSGRRTFASRVLEQTGDIEVVRNLLGHDDISCTERYLDVRPATLEAMFADAV